MATFRFTAGPWNIHEGNETFGPGHRKSIPLEEKMKKYAEIGLAGMQFHDDDAVPDMNNMTEKQIIVIPTATVPQGITAMMSFDPDENDPQTIAQAMVAAAQTVSTAQITYAARNSDFDGFAINEGDYLALLDGKLFGTSRSMDELLDKLSQHAAQAGAEYINIYTGEGVSEAEGAKTEALFAQCCPDAEVAAIPGGQSVYFYIISIE